MNIWFVRIDAGSDVRSASHTTTTATRYPHEGAFRRLIDNFDLAVLRVALQTSVKPHGGVQRRAHMAIRKIQILPCPPNG
jgi:hypothetical protein